MTRVWSADRRSALNRIADSRHVWKVLSGRVPEESYRPCASLDGYVFTAAWPWKKHPEVNPPRARFMRACKAAQGVRFEGGFAPRRRDDVEGIADLLAPKKYRFTEYLARTRSSALVFNCPAVHRCLGWKLGEFLALGKAILSLPLTRALPEPLVHGENIHYVEDDERALREAVERIAFDSAYRTRLEQGARRYYERNVAPERAIERLVWGDRA
jgi:glycosyltransferase involved in cell wall biosynthesis